MEERKVKIIKYEDAESSKGPYLKFAAKDQSNHDVNRAVFDKGLFPIVKGNVGKWVILIEDKPEGEQYWTISNIEVVTAEEAAKTREPEEVGRQKARCHVLRSACVAIQNQKTIIPSDIVTMAREFEKYVFEQTLVEVAKAMGATDLPLLEQFREACLVAQLDPTTSAGQAAIVKWLVAKGFTGGWAKLTEDQQKKAIATMKATQNELPF